MSRDLDTFLAEVRKDSKAAGPAAVAEFEGYLRHFELSRQLFELRKAHGWSQLDLSRHSGVQQSEISRIEHGQGNPTYQTLSSLATAMQMQLTFVPSVAARSPARPVKALRAGSASKPALARREVAMRSAAKTAKALGRAVSSSRRTKGRKVLVRKHA